jgi:thioredoxin:protein disulfide reductase
MKVEKIVMFAHRVNIAFCLLALLFLSLPHASFAQLNSTHNTQLSTGKTDLSRSVLSATEAFKFKSLVLGNKHLQLSWEIAPNHYLYRDKFSLASPDNLTIKLSLPPATKLNDEFFGETSVYFNAVSINIPLNALAQIANAPLQLTVQFQGCAKDRYCYPLQTQTLTLPPTP